MPLVNIKTLKGALSEDKRKEMISKVSEIVAEIEARPFPKEKLLPYTFCLIEEVDMQNWGIGGKTVTPEMLKAVLQGKT